MTREQVKELLDRVLSWPPERQADLAEVARLMEQQDKSELRLTDEQAAEVRRRGANRSAKTFTLAEASAHFGLGTELVRLFHSVGPLELEERPTEAPKMPPDLE
jgi:hypothetical protein